MVAGSHLPQRNEKAFKNSFEKVWQNYHFFFGLCLQIFDLRYVKLLGREIQQQFKMDIFSKFFTPISSKLQKFLQKLTITAAHKIFWVVRFKELGESGQRFFSQMWGEGKKYLQEYSYAP